MKGKPETPGQIWDRVVKRCGESTAGLIRSFIVLDKKSDKWIAKLVGIDIEVVRDIRKIFDNP